MRSIWLQIGVQKRTRSPAPDAFISIEPNGKEEMGDRNKSQGQEFDAWRILQGL